MITLLIISLLINAFFIWRTAKAFRAFKQLKAMSGDLKSWLDGMPNATQIPIKYELDEIDPKAMAWFHEPLTEDERSGTLESDPDHDDDGTRFGMFSKGDF